MCNNTKAISFWDFLKENTLEIPIIQRDYAQGRLGKENLRKNFLADLKKALDSGGTMKLDFVYGSIENAFTFTKYPGNDPESMAGTYGANIALDRVSYPSTKNFMFGVNFSF